MEEWIVVGTIYTTHGLRGDVKVYPLTDSPRRFLDLTDVVIEDRRGGRCGATIDRVRFQKDRVILHFEGKNSAETVAPYLQGQILVHRSQAVPLPEGRYYFADIIGLSVYTEAGECLGEVTDILETGSNEVYVVSQGGREVLIPAIREVIREVDLEGGRLVIHVMEGLLG